MGIDFQPSHGWLYRFLHRIGFTRRRITSSGRKLPENKAEIVTNFMTECQAAISSEKLHRFQIINMDETCVYLDSFSSYTYDEIGAQRVKAETTGNEKTRISIAFAAAANGYKVIFGMN